MTTALEILEERLAIANRRLAAEIQTIDEYADMERVARENRQESEKARSIYSAETKSLTEAISKLKED